MTDRSYLTRRDLALVSIGQWPIDCDRPLNKTEIEERRADGTFTGIELNVYEPWVKSGWLCFEKRNK